MKNNFKLKFLQIVALLFVIAAVLPQQNFAQRFNHPSPAASRPAPAPAFNRPPPVQQAPRPMSINGGNRNFGNHDFNRAPAVVNPRPNVVAHENVNTRPNVVAQENVNARRDVHENVNVYHTGGYRGMRPYAYHPYHPFYWGPRWHPVGFFLSALAANAIRIAIDNRYYYYDDGCYYLPSNGGYAVVTPPIGAAVSYLPDGYETVMVGNDTYYFYAGTFYIYDGQNYQVVQAPVGAVVKPVAGWRCSNRISMAKPFYFIIMPIICRFLWMGKMRIK